MCLRTCVLARSCVEAVMMHGVVLLRIRPCRAVQCVFPLHRLFPVPLLKLLRVAWPPAGVGRCSVCALFCSVVLLCYCSIVLMFNYHNIFSPCALYCSIVLLFRCSPCALNCSIVRLLCCSPCALYCSIVLLFCCSPQACRSEAVEGPLHGHCAHGEWRLLDRCVLGCAVRGGCGGAVVELCARCDMLCRARCGGGAVIE